MMGITLLQAQPVSTQTEHGLYTRVKLIYTVSTKRLTIKLALHSICPLILMLFGI